MLTPVDVVARAVEDGVRPVRFLDVDPSGARDEQWARYPDVI